MNNSVLFRFGGQKWNSVRQNSMKINTNRISSFAQSISISQLIVNNIHFPSLIENSGLMLYFSSLIELYSQCLIKLTVTPRHWFVTFK